MDYYQCAIDDLHTEIRRRGRKPTGSPDRLSELLFEDDERRGADATTVKTEGLGIYVPRDVNLSRTAEFGRTNPANLLLNEKIVYWTMNTFFTTLQLFFASGRSCTIDGSRLPDGVLGLDPELRFRLTECTYEEEGCITKTVQPDKFARSFKGLRIREAVVAQRTSVAIKMNTSQREVQGSPLSASVIARDVHTVVGLRLDGMKEISYVWVRSGAVVSQDNRVWGDVRIAGLRNDVAPPVLAFPLHTLKPG
ncbi:hypothetical protein FB567DRAFT_416318, partial [Paraphoma chrysanthemicola]